MPPRKPDLLDLAIADATTRTGVAAADWILTADRSQLVSDGPHELKGTGITVELKQTRVIVLMSGTRKMVYHARDGAPNFQAHLSKVAPPQAPDREL